MVLLKVKAIFLYKRPIILYIECTPIIEGDNFSFFLALTYTFVLFENIAFIEFPKK